MAGDLKLKVYQSAVAIFTTELNGLTDGSWALSAQIDNGTNLWVEADLLIKLNSAVSAGAGAPSLDLYLLPVPDDTTDVTPPGASAGAIPANYFVGSVFANASANFTNGVLRRVSLPPGEYRIGLQNNLGVSLPASGNTVDAYPFGGQYT